jgi:hypothetical protein
VLLSCKGMIVVLQSVVVLPLETVDLSLFRRAKALLNVSGTLCVFYVGCRAQFPTDMDRLAVS